MLRDRRRFDLVSDQIDTFSDAAMSKDTRIGVFRIVALSDSGTTVDPGCATTRRWHSSRWWLLGRMRKRLLIWATIFLMRGRVLMCWTVRLTVYGPIG